MKTILEEKERHDLIENMISLIHEQKVTIAKLAAQVLEERNRANNFENLLNLALNKLAKVFEREMTQAGK